MTDLRTSFPILEDSGTQAGLPLHKVLEADALTAKNAHAAFVAKRQSDGSARYLNMDSAGNLLVTMDGGGTPKKARGSVVGSTSITTVCDIALSVGAVYKGLSWVVSCFRDAIYEIVAIDDPSGTPTEVILADVLVGSGDITDSGELRNVTFTAGATAPILRVRAKNTSVASDFRASVCTNEDAATP
jgi:hypothetical protein